jgi:hypothetical protein
MATKNGARVNGVLIPARLGFRLVPWAVVGISLPRYRQDNCGDIPASLLVLKLPASRPK